MIARYEKRVVAQPEKMWVAKYINLLNTPHWHDECEIVFCINGQCTVKCGKETTVLTDNQCAFIHSGTVHEITSKKGTIVITLLIDNGLIKEITNKYRLIKTKINGFINIPEFYEKIRTEQKQRSDFYQIILCSDAVKLVAEIFRNNPYTKYVPVQKEWKSTLEKNILNYVEKNYATVTFEELCDVFKYSPSHFSRFFTALTGATFTSYLNYVKISRAVYYLQSEKDKNVTQISINCGFGSIRNFNRVFKKITGYSPRELPNDFTFDVAPFNPYERAQDPTSPNSVLLD